MASQGISYEYIGKAVHIIFKPLGQEGNATAGGILAGFNRDSMVFNFWLEGNPQIFQASNVHVIARNAEGEWE